jgi:hypothetical protein
MPTTFVPDASSAIRSRCANRVLPPVAAGEIPMTAFTVGTTPARGKEFRHDGVRAVRRCKAPAFAVGIASRL